MADHLARLPVPGVSIVYNRAGGSWNGVIFTVIGGGSNAG